MVGRSLFAMIVALLASLFVLGGAAEPTAIFFVGNWTIDHGQVLMLAVFAAGALGGCIHVATSFSSYVGNAKYATSWQWWYALRPFIGGCLALAFYFLIRGGLLSLTTGTNQTQEPSFYGMVAVAVMVGMFSKQATDKLDDVFDTLFKSNKDAERKDGLEVKAPVLNTVAPSSLPPGSPEQQVVITGSNLKSAQLLVDGAPRAADSTEDDRIVTTFKADELAAPKTYTLSASNSAGTAAATLQFEVKERRESDEGTPADRDGDDGSATKPATTGGGATTPGTVDITNVAIKVPGADTQGNASEASGNEAAPSTAAGAADTVPVTEAASAGESSAATTATSTTTEAATDPATTATAEGSTNSDSSDSEEPGDDPAKAPGI
jgi:hypothetical protein